MTTTEMKQSHWKHLNLELMTLNKKTHQKIGQPLINLGQLKNGKVKVEEIKYYRPSGMQGFAYNTRKTIFKNRNVRKALTYAFDFEWSNRNLFYNAYTRTKSFLITPNFHPKVYQVMKN